MSVKKFTASSQHFFTLTHSLRLSGELYLHILIWTVPFILFMVNDALKPELIKLSVLSVLCFLIIFDLLVRSLTKKARLMKTKWHVQVLQPGVILGACFFLCLVLSSFFGAHIGSFVLNPTGRYEGLWAFIIYFFIFFLTLNIGKVSDIFWISLCLSSSLTAFILLGEKYNVNFFTRQIVFGIYAPYFDPGAPYAGFGNPNFYASYASLTVPVGLYLLLVKKKYWTLPLILLQTAALFLNGSRSGIVGLVPALAVFIILVWKYVPHTRKLLLWVVPILTLSCFAFLFYIFKTNTITWARFLNIFSDFSKLFDYLFHGTPLPPGGIGSGRSFGWQLGLVVTMLHPVFGTGLGNFWSELPNIVPYHLDPQYADIYYGFSSVHNEYLQHAAETGIPSLLFYLLFIGFVLGRGFKNVKARPQNIVLLTSVIAYLIQAFFNISVPSVAWLFYLFLGLLYSPLKPEEQVQAEGR